jgi:hypothetical protein
VGSSAGRHLLVTQGNTTTLNGVVSTIASLSCASRITHTQNCIMAATFAQW